MSTLARAIANDPVIILADGKRPTGCECGQEMIDLLVHLKTLENITVISAMTMKMLDVSDRILWITTDGWTGWRSVDLQIKVGNIDGSQMISERYCLFEF